MSDPQLPAQLPTPERRDLVVQKLTQAFASGQIELEDFEQRTEQAMRAQTLADLNAALRGLTSKPVVPAPASQPSGEFAIDHPRVRGAKLSLAIMGGVHTKGKWTPATKHRVIAWMGGAMLDFRQAVLQPGVTDVYCYAMWGGIAIAVPPDLDVEVSGGAIIGGLSRLSQVGGSADPRRPRLHIHAMALMAGIHIRSLEIGEEWTDEEHDEDEEDSAT